MTQSKGSEGLYDRLRQIGRQRGGNLAIVQSRTASALQRVRDETRKELEDRDTTKTASVRLTTTATRFRHGLGRAIAGATAVSGLPSGSSLVVDQDSSPTVFIKLSLSAGGPAPVTVEYR